MTALQIFRNPTSDEVISVPCALDTFRNPVVDAESGNLEIEPQIGEPTLPGGDNPDFSADYIFCNNLSVRASGLNNSLNLNWIAPPIQPLLHATNHELGIWNGLQGNANEIVVLAIYESVLKPGIKPASGGQWSRMVICPTPGGGSFQISTDYSSSGGFPRGIDIAPSGLLAIGSQATTSWQVAGGGDGSLIPINSSSVNIGSPALQIYKAYSEEYHVMKYNNVTPQGSLFWEGGSIAGVTLSMMGVAQQPNSPGVGMGKLYFIAGTTGGTLKLVAKAGASGAQTTILDNIPQT